MYSLSTYLQELHTPSPPLSQVFETYKPGAIDRISTSSLTDYADDNSQACCGTQDTCKLEHDAGLPLCTSHTTWNTLWEGVAEPVDVESRVFSPSLCPDSKPSNLLRLDLDTAAVPGWNNFDSVRRTGDADE